MARAARIEYDGALYERFPSTGHGEKGPASYSGYPQQPYNSYHPFCLTRTRVQNTRGWLLQRFCQHHQLLFSALFKSWNVQLGDLRRGAGLPFESETAEH